MNSSEKQNQDITQIIKIYDIGGSIETELGPNNIVKSSNQRKLY